MQHSHHQQQQLVGGGGRSSGQVKWFNCAKGYGFIADDGGGCDLFVHASQIATPNPQNGHTLDELEPVQFSIITDHRGRPQAVDVTGPRGATVRGSRYASGGSAVVSPTMSGGGADVVADRAPFSRRGGGRASFNDGGARTTGGFVRRTTATSSFVGQQQRRFDAAPPPRYQTTNSSDCGGFGGGGFKDTPSFGGNHHSQQIASPIEDDGRNEENNECLSPQSQVGSRAKSATRSSDDVRRQGHAADIVSPPSSNTMNTGERPSRSFRSTRRANTKAATVDKDKEIWQSTTTNAKPDDYRTADLAAIETKQEIEEDGAPFEHHEKGLVKETAVIESINNEMTVLGHIDAVLGEMWSNSHAVGRNGSESESESLAADDKQDYHQQPDSPKPQPRYTTEVRHERSTLELGGGDTQEGSISCEVVSTIGPSTKDKDEQQSLAEMVAEGIPMIDYEAPLAESESITDEMTEQTTEKTDEHSACCLPSTSADEETLAVETSVEDAPSTHVKKKKKGCLLM